MHIFVAGITEENFSSDAIFWQNQVVHYWKLMNINEIYTRNVMNMNAFIGGLSMALNSMPVWLMNIVPISMNNTLSVMEKAACWRWTVSYDLR